MAILCGLLGVEMQDSLGQEESLIVKKIRRYLLTLEKITQETKQKDTRYNAKEKSSSV
jgi:hypothetical protein